MKTMTVCCGREIPVKNGKGRCSKCGATIDVKIVKPEPRSTRKKALQKTMTVGEMLLYGLGLGTILTIVAIVSTLGR